MEGTGRMQGLECERSISDPASGLGQFTGVPTLSTDLERYCLELFGETKKPWRKARYEKFFSFQHAIMIK